MRGPHVRLGVKAPFLHHINPYNSTIYYFLMHLSGLES